MRPEDRRTFWDTFESPYQMGAQKHRIYMLDLLRRKGVTSVFDVGCGTGPLYEIIRDRKYPFVYKGTDYSPAMIEVTNQIFPDATSAFEVQDARHLKEMNNSWDCVILMHVLDHLDDYKAAIKEAARVAKRYVCIILWRGFLSEGVHLNDRNMMGKEEGQEPWQDTFLQEYSKQALEEAFAEAGLKVVDVAEGEPINEDGRYNFLFLLKKEGIKDD